MSFILACVGLVITLLLTVLALFAAGMSDAPGQSSGAFGIFVIGTIIAALLVASHWLTHVSW